MHTSSCAKTHTAFCYQTGSVRFWFNKVFPLISKNWNPRDSQRVCIQTRSQPLTPSQCCRLFTTLFSMTVRPCSVGTGSSKRDCLEPDTSLSNLVSWKKKIWKWVSRRWWFLGSPKCCLKHMRPYLKTAGWHHALCQLTSSSPSVGDCSWGRDECVQSSERSFHSYHRVPCRSSAPLPANTDHYRCREELHHCLPSAHRYAAGPHEL